MSFNYLPIPPRVWSRVQNQCTYTVDSSYNSTYVPLINKTLPPPEAIFLDKQLYKGNILQYKANSSRLTKKQKYSQLSKGFGPSRTKVFATQSITYSNPNTTSLKRINSVNIPFPNQIVGFPNNISGPYQYNVPNPNNCNTNYLQDGGNLVCNSYVNPCTGVVIQNVSQQQCFPTYCSDVPGQIIDLCWNPKVQTWFPRNKLTNNNSTSKWPVNYKGFVSAVTPAAPVLTYTNNSDSNNSSTSITLSWTVVSNICIPISSFRIYQDGLLYKTVSYTITSLIIPATDIAEEYAQFYVTSVSNTIQSVPSNIITINFLFNATGNYTLYTSLGITGIVFNYSSTQSHGITFYYSKTVNILVVGGGGGGGQKSSNGSVGGGGGGGGGIYYSSTFNLSAGTYVINVGAKGNGAYNNELSISSGGSSSITLNGSSIITSTGGTCAISGETNGGPQGGSYDNIGNSYSNGGKGGTNSNGYDSNIPNLNKTFISLPFTSPYTTLNLSGGGGSAGSGTNTSPGGLAGKGIGGQMATHSSNNGQSALSSFTEEGSFGGGGGGTSGYGNPGLSGGNGGEGIVILWW